MALLRWIALLALALSACASNASRPWVFVCPGGEEVRLEVLETELQNQAALYDRVIEQCGKTKP